MSIRARRYGIQTVSSVSFHRLPLRHHAAGSFAPSFYFLSPIHAWFCYGDFRVKAAFGWHLAWAYKSSNSTEGHTIRKARIKDIFIYLFIFLGSGLSSARLTPHLSFPSYSIVTGHVKTRTQLSFLTLPSVRACWDISSFENLYFFPLPTRVHQQLSRCKYSKAPRPDGVPIVVLKLRATKLWHIFLCLLRISQDSFKHHPLENIHQYTHPPQTHTHTGPSTIFSIKWIENLMLHYILPAVDMLWHASSTTEHHLISRKGLCFNVQLVFTLLDWQSPQQHPYTNHCIRLSNSLSNYNLITSVRRICEDFCIDHS